MATLKDFIVSKVVPVLYTILFVAALLLLSVIPGRRQVYF